MNERSRADPTALRGQPARRGGRRGLIAAFGLCASIAWLAVDLLFLTPPGSSLLPLLLGLLVPLALIALATSLAMALDGVAAEAAVLRQQLDGLAGIQKPSKPSPQAVSGTQPAPKPAADPASGAGPAAAPAQPSGGGRQAQLPLPPAPHGPPLSLIDLIRALHFPETSDDQLGLSALSRAMRDPGARPVVQAAQDMLTLLSQDGIYVDDLPRLPHDADRWRQIAAGNRRRGALLDEDGAALKKCRDKLHSNTVYRDTAHHFLRRFDQLIARHTPDISDDALIALSATRSARAFALVGAAAGMFDPE